MSGGILGKKDRDSVLLHAWPKLERKWINPTLSGKIEKLSKIRCAALKAIESEREKGLIHSSLEVRVRLYAKTDELFQFLKGNLNLLVSIFIVSDVSVQRVSAFSKGILTNPENEHLGMRVEKIDFSKCARCWNYRSSVGKTLKHPKICERCVKVLEGRN